MTALTVVGGAARPDWKTKTFPERLLELYSRMSYMQKAGKNEAMRYKFLQEAAVKRALNDACRDLGIIVANVMTTVLPGSTPQAAVVSCVIRLVDAGIHEDSKTLTVVEWGGVGCDQDKTGKAVMKAEAAAYKYAVTQGCMVSTGDDPESNEDADGQAYDDLVTRITQADTTAALIALKVEVGEWRKHEGFDALKDAYQARMKTLQGGGSVKGEQT